MIRKLILSLALFLTGIVIVAGCGQSADTSEVPTTTSSTVYAGYPTTTLPSVVSPTNGLSSVFNVSGAVAIASAKAGMVSSSGLKALTVSSADSILKLTASGELVSIFTNPGGYSSTISVIETGPDGSLYVGLTWGIYLTVPGTMGGTVSKQLAFFRIKPDGSPEVVDDTVVGMGSWYNSSNGGELPAKQVQFDSDGNVYYLGRVDINGTTTTVLKKKTTAGDISQIGNANMEVRDFLVCPNGIVLFHGSNAGNWSQEWLRAIYNNSVHNIFYNDGSSGYLRAYYIDKSGHVLLVGSNLTVEDQDGSAIRLSGIIHATLDSTGKPTLIEPIYDDNNMYNNYYSKLSDQLLWGYWDPSSAATEHFFTVNDHDSLIRPLVLQDGVTEASIRTYIRKKYQKITTDTLADLTFTGMDVERPSEEVHGTWVNNLNDKIDAELAFHIVGTTWKQWREDNGLTNISFGSAKQILTAADGAVYAVMPLDNWGTSKVKGDKLLRIINSSGQLDMVAYLQYPGFLTVDKARTYGNYCVYKSSTVGKGKILRIDLADAVSAPIDMTADKINAEIFNFNFNPVTSMLMYDVYDMNNNTSYLVDQLITSASAASANEANGYTITDIVPFQATQ